MDQSALYLAQIFRVGNAIIDFFLDTDRVRVVFLLKVFSALFSGLMVLGIIEILRRHRRAMIEAVQKSSQASAPEVRQKEEHEAWGNILKRWNSQVASDKRLALIEADALLDTLLKELGIEGETMAERFADPALPPALPKAELGFAHAFRNELVHEVGSTFDPVDAQRAFSAYERALKELII